MKEVNIIPPNDAHSRLATDAATLIDIREADEYARRHIDGALSWPLSRWDAGEVPEVAGDVIFTCKSGMRTGAACGRLAGMVRGETYMLDGGTDGWAKAGLPLVEDKRAPLEMMRQVQIAAGLLILIGVLLGYLAETGWFLLSGFVGAGLLFAGLTGFCGMAKLLMLAPWNRRPAS